MLHVTTRRQRDARLKLVRALFEDLRHYRRNRTWSNAWITCQTFIRGAVPNVSIIHEISFPLFPFTVFPPVSHHSTVYFEMLAALLNAPQIQQKLNTFSVNYWLLSVLARPPDGSSSQTAQIWPLCLTGLWKKRLLFTQAIYYMTNVSYFPKRPLFPATRTDEL